jgi:hypothetical protein
LNQIGELAASPVFQAMNLPILGGYHATVPLNHRGHLLALIGVNNENDFVMSHASLLMDRAPRDADTVGQGEEVGTILNQGENINQEKHLKLETNQAPRRKQRVLTALLQSAGFQPAFARRSGELNPQRLRNKSKF